MKKKPVSLLIGLPLCICLAAGLSACAQADTAQTAAPTSNIQPMELEDATGLYTNVLTGEQMRDRLVASWSAVTHLETMRQFNTLVLTKENTTITTGDTYELTKDLYNGEMGIHIEARFYGNYTADGNQVTLAEPDYYTWIYYRNGRVMGDPVVYQPVDPEATGNDGASFFGDYLDYHGYHRVAEMNVLVDPDTGEFAFDIAENDDAAALGNESEDDGFNAGPIFEQNLTGATAETAEGGAEE